MNFYKILAVCLPLIFLSGCDWFDDDEPAATPQTFEQKKSELEQQIAALQNCQEGTDEEKAECQTKLGELTNALQELLQDRFSVLLGEIEKAETDEAKQEKCGQLTSLEVAIEWTTADKELSTKKNQLCVPSTGYPSAKPPQHTISPESRPYDIRIPSMTSSTGGNEQGGTTPTTQQPTPQPPTPQPTSTTPPE